MYGQCCFISGLFEEQREKNCGMLYVELMDEFIEGLLISSEKV